MSGQLRNLDHDSVYVIKQGQCWKLAQRDDYPQGNCNANDAFSYPPNTVLIRHSIQRWGQRCVGKDIRVFR